MSRHNLRLEVKYWRIEDRNGIADDGLKIIPSFCLPNEIWNDKTKCYKGGSDG